MSSSNRQDDAAWSDFDNLRHSVKSHTVDRLKQIITGLAEENGVVLSKSGKKQELIDRITNELERYCYLRQTENWAHARNVLYQVRNSGMYTSSGASQTFTANHNFTLNNAHGSTYAPPRAPSSGFHAINNVGTSSIARYDPYAPPRRPLPGHTTSSPARPSPGTAATIRFKSSPFFRVDQAVSSVVECPESSGSMDRRSQTLTFALTQEHINKLSSSGSNYQLRLYCTTNTFYTPSPTGFRSSTTLCPIEFPATCEVRVNNTPLQANLKGIKKRPGTAPPADLSKAIRMAVGQPNRIEMIYVNSQANTLSKKFYLVVFLVEVSTVDQLVDRLRKGKFRSSEEIRAQMVKSAVGDEDIVIGKQKMTLKCPLSYTRINVPCRSSKCVHPQCFDAISWYSVMEQTTTWLCPVCEKALNPEELIVDGYFGGILQQTPESVEEVEVEADGEWHTSDNKIGSKGWMDAHRSKQTEKTLSAPGTKSSKQPRSSTSSAPRTSSPNPASVSRSLGEVVILDSDSDNEDETRVKRELSPANSASISVDTSRNGLAPTKSASSAVIDLTLDSEDEDAPPAAPLLVTKRKASETLERPEDAAYKKSRLSGTPMPTIGGERLHNGYSNRGSSVSSGPDIHPQSPYPRISLPLPRQVSGSSVNNQHHHSPPSTTSPPAMYYPPHPPPMPAQSSRPFIPYTVPYHQPPAMNGSGMVPYNGTAVDAPRQRAATFNPYLPRPNGTGGSGWP